MRRVILSAAFAISTLTTCIYLQQPAHADDTIIKNYDADGNYTGYSQFERETDEQAVQRMRGEVLDACIKARIPLEKCI
jgi:hypothetical protein